MKSDTCDVDVVAYPPSSTFPVKEMMIVKTTMILQHDYYCAELFVAFLQLLQ